MNFIMKPTSFSCNMVCKYCFYLEKAVFMTNSDKRNDFMDSGKALKIIEKQLSTCPDEVLNLIWQGGEPLLAGIDFYREIVRGAKELADKYHKRVTHAVQTNGTLLTDEWCKFLKAENILVGLSIDGDEELHGTYRKLRTGDSSFGKVLKAIKLLQKHKVDFNTLTVVNNINVDYPLRVYNFLKGQGVRFMQFIPVVETLRPYDENHTPKWIHDGDCEVTVTEFTVDPLKYGKFITTIFDEWIRKDVNTISIRLFDTMVQHFRGFAPSLCVFMDRCGGENMVLEANGTVYQCDHFVYPTDEFKLGDFLDIPTEQLEQHKHVWSKRKQDLSAECKACKWYEICYGGCPKHRFVKNPEGDRKTYFCSAYKHIFEHITPGLNLIVEFLESNIPLEYLPAAVDKVYSTTTN